MDLDILFLRKFGKEERTVNAHGDNDDKSSGLDDGKVRIILNPKTWKK